MVNRQLRAWVSEGQDFQHILPPIMRVMKRNFFVLRKG